MDKLAMAVSQSIGSKRAAAASNSTPASVFRTRTGAYPHYRAILKCTKTDASHLDWLKSCTTTAGRSTVGKRAKERKRVQSRAKCAWALCPVRQPSSAGLHLTNIEDVSFSRRTQWRLQYTTRKPSILRQLVFVAFLPALGPYD